MQAECCPNCHRPTVITGTILTEGHYGSDSFSFVPRGTRFRFWSGPPQGVSTGPGLRACIACGHTWHTVDPEKLRAFIEAEGDEQARQDLLSLMIGPDHDIPDIPEARQAAAKVAEIDALIRMDRAGEATRRYRELKPTIWDDAIAAVRRWRELPRARKLALFGWDPPPLPAKEEGKTPEGGHPMQDRWLDG